jgi:hypothetical protein
MDDRNIGEGLDYDRRFQYIHFSGRTNQLKILQNPPTGPPYVRSNLKFNFEPGL